MYSEDDFNRANKCVDMMKEACESDSFGIRVEDPEYIEVTSGDSRQRDGVGYVKHCNGFPFDKYKFVVVILNDPKHKKVVKAFLDKSKIVSQFVLGSTIDRAKITVYSNILKQINAKLCQDLYRIEVPANLQNTMVVGVDVVNAGRRAIIGMTASYSKHMTQHYSQVVCQDLLKELVGKSLTKQEQEEKVC